MRRMIRATCRLLGFVLPTLVFALAAGTNTRDASAGPRFVFVEENDALASNRDYGYTQGLRASLVFDVSAIGSPGHTAFDMFGGFLFAPAGAAQRQLEWIMVGQSIFTPANKTLVPPDPFDRPYAG